MCEVNSNTRTASMMAFWWLNCKRWIYFTTSSISISDFEQINDCWVQLSEKYRMKWSNSNYNIKTFNNGHVFPHLAKRRLNFESSKSEFLSSPYKVFSNRCHLSEVWSELCTQFWPHREREWTTVNCFEMQIYEVFVIR